MLAVTLRILLSLVAVLIAIAFYTLWERKAMGASHRRYGPVLVGWFGLLQPVADGLKLAVKEFVSPKHSVGILFILTPPAVMALSLVAWGLIPFSASDVNNVVEILTEVSVNGREGALSRGVCIAQRLQDSRPAPVDVNLGLEFVTLPEGVFLTAMLYAAGVCVLSWLKEFTYHGYKEKGFPLDARASITDGELVDRFLSTEHVRGLVIHRGASPKWASRVAELANTRRKEQGWWDLLVHTHPWVTVFFGVCVAGLVVGAIWNTSLVAGLGAPTQKIAASLKQLVTQARLEGQAKVNGLRDLEALECELNWQLTTVFSALEAPALFLPVAISVLLLAFAVAFFSWLTSRGWPVSAVSVLLSRSNLLFLSSWHASYVEYVTWDCPVSSHSQVSNTFTDMTIESARLIGAGLATISLGGTGVGIGIVFSALVAGTARNPSANKQLFIYTILGFALTEAIALFGLMMAFLILFN